MGGETETCRLEVKGIARGGSTLGLEFGKWIYNDMLLHDACNNDKLIDYLVKHSFDGVMYGFTRVPARRSLAGGKHEEGKQTQQTSRTT
jgi:hypothetical protein